MSCATFQNSDFLIYCSVLAVLDSVCFVLLLAQFVAICCLLSKCKDARLEKGGELKRVGSVAPLLGEEGTTEQYLEFDFRNASFVRTEVDKDAIYGPTESVGFRVQESVEKEAFLESQQQRRQSGKVTTATAIFESETAFASKPVRKPKKITTDRAKIKKLSQKFRGGSQVPSGLIALPEKEEIIEPKDEPKQPPKPKKAPPPKRVKDPPSVFKGRKGRDDFLDDEFADLVEQTNQRLAEYTLAGIVDNEVSVFANQHITEKNIKHSKFEFSKAFDEQKPEAHTRKTSDQKNLLLVAQSVYDDFDSDIPVKKPLDTSLHSVASRRTEFTAVSRDNIAP